MLSFITNSPIMRNVLLFFAIFGVITGAYIFGSFNGQKICSSKIANETIEKLRDYEKISRKVESDVQTKSKTDVVNELRSSGWLRPDSEID